MSAPSTTAPSFSAGRRWGIFFSVVISIVMMVALVLMLNYLGARHYMRFMLSTQPGVQLSPQTLSLLKYVTNDVQVIVYYDKGDKLYNPVITLLDEYHLKNPKISVEKVDYLVESTKAQLIKDTYKLGAAENLVIFVSNGRYKIIPEALLGEYTLNETGKVTDKGEIEMERDLKAFAGEKWFSAGLLSVISARQMLACFLEGHGEHSIESAGHDGYAKFAEVLLNCNIYSMPIRLHGTNMIPADCNLLVIPGPRNALPADELAKINEYLNQGGRAFILFNYNTSYPKAISTGLEKILADWNVRVGMNKIADSDNASGDGLIVSHFNQNHPVGAQLQGSSLEMYPPRSIEVLNLGNTGPETPKAVELAYSSKIGVTTDNPKPRTVPMLVAVEKGAVKGVLHQRGTTAMLVAGDSMFLDNDLIDADANRDFAGIAANWLLDQTQLLQGLGSHPITEYKLTMTKAQMASVQLIFLLALPGAILGLGGLVWFRRRH
jgi:hypothetical protein